MSKNQWLALESEIDTIESIDLDQADNEILNLETIASQLNISL